MTNEQHIENLKKLKSFHNGSYGADIDRAIEALRQEPKWIPVEHELPEKGKQVLCCNKHGSVFTSAITYIEKYKDGNKYVCFGQHCDVIAWQPLPGAYNVKQEE